MHKSINWSNWVSNRVYWPDYGEMSPKHIYKTLVHDTSCGKCILLENNFLKFNIKSKLLEAKVTKNHYTLKYTVNKSILISMVDSQLMPKLWQRSLRYSKMRLYGFKWNKRINIPFNEHNTVSVYYCSYSSSYHNNLMSQSTSCRRIKQQITNFIFFVSSPCYCSGKLHS